jgi:hypothetical protein
MGNPANVAQKCINVLHAFESVALNRLPVIRSVPERKQVGLQTLPLRQALLKGWHRDPQNSSRSHQILLTVVENSLDVIGLHLGQ